MKTNSSMWWFLVLGIILTVLAVVFWQPAFDQVACKWAKNIGNKSCACGSGGSGGGGSTWDGECTPEIERDCCAPTFSVRMCDGRIVSDPRDCYDLYCEADNSKCKPVEQIIGGFKCTCGSIYEGYT